MSTAHVCHLAGARHGRVGQHGISLIELMIAMAIGLLTTLAISGVMLATEQQRREATSGSDAQVNGALALYTMQRDLQMGGYGLTGIDSVAGCEIRGKKGTAPTQTSRLAPVVISNGDNVASQRIDIGTGTHREFSVPIRIAVDHTRGGDTFSIADKTNIGNAVGDLMIAVPNNPSSTEWCSMFTVSELPTGNTVRHQASDAHPWNHAAPESIFPGATDTALAYPAGSFLVNLGRLVSRTYSLSANNALQLQTVASDALADPPQDLLPNIVGLQAVYGKDTNNDRTADVWNAVTPTTPIEWKQVVAVRIAIVARSVQFDKEEVTTALPQWKPDGQTETDIRIDLTNPTDWKHYRYHVYESAVPLRNMLWQSPQ